MYKRQDVTADQTNESISLGKEMSEYLTLHNTQEEATTNTKYFFLPYTLILYENKTLKYLQGLNINTKVSHGNVNTIVPMITNITDRDETAIQSNIRL